MKKNKKNPTRLHLLAQHAMELLSGAKTQAYFKICILVPTWSNGRCVAEVRVHLILARLSFALLWQAVDSAAYAQRNQ